MVNQAVLFALYSYYNEVSELFEKTINFTRQAMKLNEAKKQFIGEWGTFGSQWGVNRTMAQAHALLMVSAKPMSAEDVMKELEISRGNANMNLRALIDWGLIKKTHIAGERKEFFIAEKNIWKVTRQVIKERKRRELEPLRNMLGDLKTEIEVDDDESKEFKKMMEELEQFATAADTSLDRMIQSDRQWVFESLLKFMSR